MVVGNWFAQASGNMRGRELGRPIVRMVAWGRFAPASSSTRGRRQGLPIVRVAAWGRGEVSDSGGGKDNVAAVASVFS